jgi:hypothetical protein
MTSILLLGQTAAPYGLDNLFDPFYANIEDKVDTLYGPLSNFCYLLAFAGLLITAYRIGMSGDLSGLGQQLLSTAIVAIALLFLPEWMMDAQDTLGWKFMIDLGYDPTAVIATYVGELAAIIAFTALETFAISILSFNLFALVAGIVIVILDFILLILASLLWFAMIIGFMLQIAGIYIGTAVAPIFLGMILFPQTRENGIKYFLGLVAILFWPLGWGLGMALVESTIEMAPLAMAELAILTGVLELSFPGITLFLVALIQFLLLYVVVMKSPGIVAKAIATGSQIGSAMMSSLAGAAMSTASGAVGAAGAVGGAAISAAGVAAAPMTGGASLAVGGAAGGAVGSASSGASKAVAPKA